MKPRCHDLPPPPPGYWTGAYFCLRRGKMVTRFIWQPWAAGCRQWDRPDSDDPPPVREGYAHWCRTCRWAPAEVTGAR